jgi:hypothetical protein
MKRKFFSVAKKLGLSITSYKSERSDMGFQCFVFEINNRTVDAAYAVGDDSGNLKKECIALFERDLKYLFLS